MFDHGAFWEAPYLSPASIIASEQHYWAEFEGNQAEKMEKRVFIQG